MRRSLLLFLIVLWTSGPALAQRTDLGLTGFTAREQSQLQLTAPYLVIQTTAVVEGGAERCIELTGTIGGFGGVVFIPRLRNGRQNLGTAEIALAPYVGPGCTGLSLNLIRAAPKLDNSSRRDVDIELSFLGAIPPQARSARFVVYTAASGEDPFMVCFRSPWLQNGFVGSPDLAVTDVTVHVASLDIAFAASSQPVYVLTPGNALKQGEMVPRGRIAMMYVGIANVGTAPANPPWSVTITTPRGVFGGRTSTITFTHNCTDFPNSTHNGATAMAPGEARTLCGAFVPASGAAAIQVSARTSVANDANAQNDQRTSPFFEVESTRGIQVLPPLIPRPSNGR